MRICFSVQITIYEVSALLKVVQKLCIQQERNSVATLLKLHSSVFMHRVNSNLQRGFSAPGEKPLG